MKTFYIICLFFAVLSCENFSNKKESLIDAEFPLVGTWYVNDSGEDYNDNALNFSEYTFGEPDRSGGKLLGKLRLVPFNGEEEREGEYEIVEENKLVIYLLNELDYTFTYTYFPEEEKVEMNYAGQDRTLVREKPVAETASTPEGEKFKQTLLILEKIGGVVWRNELWTTKFTKPTKEGDIYTGELHNRSDYDYGYIYKYELSADGELNLRFIKETVGDQERPVSDEGTLRVELLILNEDENSIIVKVEDKSENVYTRV